MIQEFTNCSYTVQVFILNLKCAGTRWRSSFQGMDSELELIGFILLFEGESQHESFILKQFLRRSTWLYWIWTMLIAKLKEDREGKDRPSWKWTLVYARKKIKSFKLQCCLSSLHMLICLREKRPGGCGFLNIKLPRFMQFSFSLYLLSYCRLPCLTQPPVALCLQRRSWRLSLVPLPSSTWPISEILCLRVHQQQMRDRHVSLNICIIFCAVLTFTLQLGASCFRGAKVEGNAPTNKPAPVCDKRRWVWTSACTLRSATQQSSDKYLLCLSLVIQSPHNQGLFS